MATKEGRHQHIVRNDDGTVFLVNVTVSGNPLDRSGTGMLADKNYLGDIENPTILGTSQ